MHLRTYTYITLSIEKYKKNEEGTMVKMNNEWLVELDINLMLQYFL